MAPTLKPDYSRVFALEHNATQNAFLALPGFTRSAYEREYAVVTPESRVWASNPAWQASTTAHIVSKASGAHFSMYLVSMKVWVVLSLQVLNFCSHESPAPATAAVDCR
jgi:hypothetical protein